MKKKEQCTMPVNRSGQALTQCQKFLVEIKVLKTTSNY